jgi:hypothetical protein
MDKYSRGEKCIVFGTTLALALFIMPAALSSLCTGSLPSDLQVWAQTTPNIGSQGPIVKQGIVTSSTDPLPGHETHQSATVLRLRGDNGVYSGILTFTANKPVEVQILHTNLNNSLRSVPGEFGPFNILPLPTGQSSVTISNVIPQFPDVEDTTTFAASIPFTGNAIALHNIEGEPFAATYTVTAGLVGQAERADEVGQAPSTSTPSAANEEAEEDEENENEEN